MMPYVVTRPEWVNVSRQNIIFSDWHRMINFIDGSRIYIYIYTIYHLIQWWWCNDKIGLCERLVYIYVFYSVIQVCFKLHTIYQFLFASMNFQCYPYIWCLLNQVWRNGILAKFPNQLVWFCFLKIINQLKIFGPRLKLESIHKFQLPWSSRL